jgi:hypothetical protein
LVQDLLSSFLLPNDLKIKIYKITILPVVLYGCETWSVIFKEEQRSRVFEDRVRVLKRIFGAKRKDETGGWRRLHRQELRNLYASPNIIRMIKSRRARGAGLVARKRHEKCIQNFRWKASQEETTRKT